MKKVVSLAALLCFLAPSAFAQTGVGVGVGQSSSNSASGSAAISGSSITINNPAETRVRTEASGTTTIRSAPSMVAPGLTAAGLETCLGSASGTVSAVGFGIGGGSTYKDEDCTARLDSRTLFAMGLKGAAVARLCQRPDIWRSMPDVCERYWPAGVALPHGIAAPSRGVVMSATQSGPGGPLEVVDGRTGQTRLCDKYDPVKLKCWKWQGEAEQRYVRTRHVAVTTPPSIKPAAKPKATSKPAIPAVITQGPKPSAEPAKTEAPKADDKK